MEPEPEYLECPFCSRVFRPDAQLVQLHVEEEHTEDSPFVVREDNSNHEGDEEAVSEYSDSDPESDDEEQGEARPALPPRTPPKSGETGSKDRVNDDFRRDFVECPEAECGEVVLLVDLNEHLDYHLSERAAAPIDSDRNRHHASSSSGAAHRSSISSPLSLISKAKSKASRSSKHSTSHISSGRSASASSLTLDESSSPSSSSGQRPVTPETPPSTHTTNFATSISPALRSRAGSRRMKRRSRHSSSQSHEDAQKHRTGLRRSFKNFVSGVSSFIDGRAEKAVEKMDMEDGLRLGYKQLGPYAYEDHMPVWLWEQLEAGPRIHKERRIGRDGRLTTIERIENHHEGVVPRLAELSEMDPGVREAWYCHPAVPHIVRFTHEGGFCGYRNIQMQISYIQGAKAPGHTALPPGRVPTVPQLQDWIEDAWDNGISELSRAQIGRLKGTRKWIGTAEAHALYQQLGIQNEVHTCADDKDGRRRAHQVLFDYVEDYFRSDVQDDSQRLKVHRTYRPPIYLQQPGHSLTIVGYEKHKNGSRNIVVFDTIFNTPRYMQMYLDRKVHRPGPEFIVKAMHIYRRGSDKLRKYKDFELVLLKGEQPRFPAWEILRDYDGHTLVHVFYHGSTKTYHIYPDICLKGHFIRSRYCAHYFVDEARLAPSPPTSEPKTTAGLCVPRVWWPRADGRPGYAWMIDWTLFGTWRKAQVTLSQPRLPPAAVQREPDGWVSRWHFPDYGGLGASPVYGDYGVTEPRVEAYLQTCCCGQGGHMTRHYEVAEGCCGWDW